MGRARSLQLWCWLRAARPAVAQRPRPPCSSAAGWQQRLKAAVVLDETDVIVVNKPSGLAVHGGGGAEHDLVHPELHHDLHQVG